MPRELPPSVTIDEAAALILNISYLPGDAGLLEMLQYFREEAEAQYDKAQTMVDRQRFESRIRLFAYRADLAQQIIATIGAELAAIDKGRDSLLEVVDGSFGHEKLGTGSVYAWAEHIGFGIGDWEPPRFWRPASERQFRTEWLSILDHVIATFCEKGGEHYSATPPKKDVVKAWIREHYGDLSDKVLDAMATMIRPGLTPSTKTKT
jgi:hypothetical protein